MANKEESMVPEKIEAPRTISELFTSEYVKVAIQKAAPRHLSAERFLRIANTALTRTPKLKECTVSSLWKCLIDLSSLGLEPDGRRAHLIPYGKEATLIVDYKGIVECVRRSGEVSDIFADIVCDKDDFEFDRGKVTRHKINFRESRGEMYAAYSYVKFKDGTESYQVMSREEIDAIRKRSKASNNGPWVTDYNEMAKKTCFRRASKWLPFSAELHQAIETDDRHLFPDIERDTISASDIREIPNGSRMKIRRPDPKPVEAETELKEGKPENAPEPEAKPETESGPEKISTAQVKRFHALVNADPKWTKEQAKTYLTTCGFESSKDITVEVYEAICERLGVEPPREEA